MKSKTNQSHKQAPKEAIQNDCCARAERAVVLNTLNLISRQLRSNTPINDVLTQIVEQIRENLQYQSVDIHLLNTNHDTLIPLRNVDHPGTEDLPPCNIPIEHPDNPSARAVREKHLINIPFTSKTQDALPGTPNDTYAAIAVPITEDTHTVGSLTVHAGQEVGLGLCDNYILQSLANQISVTMTRVRLGEEIEEARSAAKIAERTKSEFLSRMSHELRTPLNGILGYTQILRRTAKPGTMEHHGLDIIQQSSEHLLALINDVLDFARMEALTFSLQPDDFNLDNFLRKITDDINPRAQNKGLNFIVEAEPPLPQGLHADKIRLQRVLTNLLDNAIQYTEQGDITLLVQQIATPDNPKDVKTLHFAVSDTGVGIADDALQKIFLPFEQIKNDDKAPSEGIGLGLALADQIVRLMGGTLQAESTIGRGSTFWFDIALPVADIPSQAEVPFKKQAIIGYTGNRRKILVVDDKAYNRTLLRNILTPLGFEISEAGDGLVCIHMAQQIHPDLIIMDMIMPGMTGFEATQHIREIPDLQGTVILGTSASVFEEDRQKVTLTGCDAFLSKPLDVTQLLVLLQERLHLEWLYLERKSEPDIEPTQMEEMTPPQKAELSDLYEIAKLGNMRKVSAWAEALSNRDAKYQPFADKIKELARKFQKKQIVTLIETYLEA